MTTMTAPELNSRAASVYGNRWQSALGRDMGVALRTVQRWARDGIDKPATAEGVRRFLNERAAGAIAPPPAGSTDKLDRDDACADALEPAATALVAKAEAAGWSRPEIDAALLSLIVSDMRAIAGDRATRATLAAAIQMLDD